MQYMDKCCEKTPRPLVKVKKGDKTCKINAAALTVFNTYILNRIQDFENNNTFDFANPKLTKELGSDAVRIKTI